MSNLQNRVIFGNINNIVYCGFATNCLARSLRSHHHPVSSKSDNIPARSSLRSSPASFHSASRLYYWLRHLRVVKL